MTQKPFILITNDDGIHAKGIKHLWRALVDKADLVIVAPSSEKSGVGLAITLRDPLHSEAVPWERGTPAWKVSGTPADCVRFGTSLILERKPDLIVSGINRGANSGRNVLYSGTVGGVIEGVLRDIPGVAFSCEEWEHPDYDAAEKQIFAIVEHVLNDPLPRGTFLNVNFPASTSDFKGFKLAKQGRSYFIENFEKRLHPEGYPYFWMNGRQSDHEEEPESDVALLSQGYISAVPIHVGELTDHVHLRDRKASFESLVLGS